MLGVRRLASGGSGASGRPSRMHQQENVLMGMNELQEFDVVHRIRW